MGAQSFVLECMEQGIDRTEFSTDEAVDWFNREAEFWQTANWADESVILSGRNFGSANLKSGYARMLSDILVELPTGGFAKATRFMKEAAALRLVIAQGGIGKDIQDLLRANQNHSAHRIALIFSPSVARLGNGEGNAQIDAERAMLKFNPFMATKANVVDAEKASAQARQALERAKTHAASQRAMLEAELTKLNDLIEHTKSDLEALHNSYEGYLVLQGPSRHWRKVAERAGRFASFAFAAFCLLIAAPAILIAFNWAEVSKYVDHILDVTKGSLSIASILVFTVPVLAYGWILKHVSRVFTQNLTISSDAEHRRVMAVTFLGLARRKGTAIDEKDRALILNALFRPSPLTPQDDGPPAGLLELVKR